MEINIPYDNELVCPVCKAVGLNMLDKEEIIRGDEIVGFTHFIICECGNVIKEIEDD